MTLTPAPTAELLGDKYRKKPVVIEAVEWSPHASVYPEWLWSVLSVNPQMFDAATGELVIGTLEGEMRAQPGDWIIKGVKGELYPCKPDIFEASYERAEQPRSGEGHAGPSREWLARMADAEDAVGGTVSVGGMDAVDVPPVAAERGKPSRVLEGPIKLPVAQMAGCPWNLLDATGCRIALCGGDSHNDHERFGPAICAALVRALNGPSVPPTPVPEQRAGDDGKTIGEQSGESCSMCGRANTWHPDCPTCRELTLLEQRAAAAESQLAAAREQVDAIKKFAKHHALCALNNTRHLPCDCGLEALLAPPASAPRVDELMEPRVMSASEIAAMEYLRTQPVALRSHK